MVTLQIGIKIYLIFFDARVFKTENVIAAECCSFHFTKFISFNLCLFSKR